MSEHFRNVCPKNYDLDPAHYHTAPGLAWDATLKFTRVKLRTLKDWDMHLFFEEGMRGGISMISNRYRYANNPYLPDFDPHLPTSDIIYLDATNLYGWMMIQPLPVGEFEWMTEEQIKHFKVEDIPDDVDYGYALQVDLHYPPELHDLHSDYPLAPAKMSNHT